MSRKKTIEEVIAGFIEVHGKRYNYSLVTYIKAVEKVKIICEVHGMFEQTPNSHLNGAGCPDCGGLSHLNNKKIIDAFHRVHGNKYDYSFVRYVANHSKIEIGCREHGIFEQSPNSHLRGHGCPDCGGNPHYNDSKIIASFREIHGVKYDYSMVSYVNAKTKVRIKCKTHGLFEQAPQIT